VLPGTTVPMTATDSANDAANTAASASAECADRYAISASRWASSAFGLARQTRSRRPLVDSERRR
jgi:hypothetical protein